MSEKLSVKKPLYPVLGLAGTIFIIVFGLLNAESDNCFFFLSSVWVLFIIFGYWRSCIAVIPVAIVMCAFLAGITYAISRDINSTMAAINRIFALCVAVIPGLAMPPIALVRSMTALKVPRMITLGMMITFNFIPLLKVEVKRVREAMKTRGAGSLFSLQIFYRAFLIPLIMRLVNISDILALSVETRGFTAQGEHTVYKSVKLNARDIIFVLLLLTGAVLTVIL